MCCFFSICGFCGCHGHTATAQTAVANGCGRSQRGSWPQMSWWLYRKCPLWRTLMSVSNFMTILSIVEIFQSGPTHWSNSAIPRAKLPKMAKNSPLFLHFEKGSSLKLNCMCKMGVAPLKNVSKTKWKLIFIFNLSSLYCFVIVHFVIGHSVKEIKRKVTETSSFESHHEHHAFG